MCTVNHLKVAVFYGFWQGAFHHLARGNYSFWWIFIENKKDFSNGGRGFLGVGEWDAPQFLAASFSNVSSFFKIMKVIPFARAHLLLLTQDSKQNLGR